MQGRREVRYPLTQKVSTSFVSCLAISCLIHLWVATSPVTRRALRVLSFWGMKSPRRANTAIEFDLQAPPPEEAKPKAKKSPTFIDEPKDIREDKEAPKNSDLIGMKNVIARDNAVEKEETDEQPHMTGKDRDVVSNLAFKKVSPQPVTPPVLAAVAAAATKAATVLNAPAGELKPQTAPAEAQKSDGDERVAMVPRERIRMSGRKEPAALVEPAPKASETSLMTVPVPSRASPRRSAIRLDSPESATRRKGELSFNIKAHEYAPYYKHILDRIALSWYIHSGWDFSAALKPGEEYKIVVTFLVGRTGEIHDAKIVDDGGNLLLATRILGAVKSASPLKKFDQYIKEDRLAIRFTFLF